METYLILALFIGLISLVNIINPAIDYIQSIGVINIYTQHTISCKIVLLLIMILIAPVFLFILLNRKAQQRFYSSFEHQISMP